jgi:internalin A
MGPKTSLDPRIEHAKQPLVFISYSHLDQKWLNGLLDHLKPLGLQVNSWSDRKIEPGGDWRAEIEAALRKAKVAVLLVSRTFLASDFIMKEELPFLLRAAEQGTLTILWVPLTPTVYKHTEIAKYQAVHNPAEPLGGLDKTHRNQALVAICEKILEATMKKTHGAA